MPNQVVRADDNRMMGFIINSVSFSKCFFQYHTVKKSVSTFSDDGPISDHNDCIEYAFL